MSARIICGVLLAGPSVARILTFRLLGAIGLDIVTPKPPLGLAE
jgi:hypothetical protein